MLKQTRLVRDERGWLQLARRRTLRHVRDEREPQRSRPSVLSQARRPFTANWSRTWPGTERNDQVLAPTGTPAVPLIRSGERSTLWGPSVILSGRGASSDLEAFPCVHPGRRSHQCRQQREGRLGALRPTRHEPAMTPSTAKV